MQVPVQTPEAISNWIVEQVVVRAEAVLLKKARVNEIKSAEIFFMIPLRGACSDPSDYEWVCFVVAQVL